MIYIALGVLLLVLAGCGAYGLGLYARVQLAGGWKQYRLQSAVSRADRQIAKADRMLAILSHDDYNWWRWRNVKQMAEQEKRMAYIKAGELDVYAAEQDMLE